LDVAVDDGIPSGNGQSEEQRYRALLEGRLFCLPQRRSIVERDSGFSSSFNTAGVFFKIIIPRAHFCEDFKTFETFHLG